MTTWIAHYSDELTTIYCDTLVTDAKSSSAIGFASKMRLVPHNEMVIVGAGDGREINKISEHFASAYWVLNEDLIEMSLVEFSREMSNETIIFASWRSEKRKSLVAVSVQRNALEFLPNGALISNNPQLFPFDFSRKMPLKSLSDVLHSFLKIPSEARLESATGGAVIATELRVDGSMVSSKIGDFGDLRQVKAGVAAKLRSDAARGKFKLNTAFLRLLR